MARDLQFRPLVTLPTSAEERRTVLLVEDDDNTRESVQRIIERFGWTCAPAANGPEALQLLRERQLGVVVADHDMPGMDGVELLKLIATRYPHVSRILLTARRDVDVAVRAINLGQAYRFLSKPCRASELATALHFAFDLHDAEVGTRKLSAKLRRNEELLARVRERYPALVEELEASLPPLP
jgi:DNA-binding NtrC family response regulator